MGGKVLQYMETAGYPEQEWHGELKGMVDDGTLDTLVDSIAAKGPDAETGDNAKKEKEHEDEDEDGDKDEDEEEEEEEKGKEAKAEVLQQKQAEEATAQEKEEAETAAEAARSAAAEKAERTAAEMAEAATADAQKVPEEVDTSVESTPEEALDAVSALSSPEPATALAGDFGQTPASADVKSGLAVCLAASRSSYGVVLKKLGSKATVDFSASGGKKSQDVKRTDLLTMDPALLPTSTGSAAPEEAKPTTPRGGGIRRRMSISLGGGGAPLLPPSGEPQYSAKLNGKAVKLQLGGMGLQVFEKNGKVSRQPPAHRYISGALW